MENEVEWGCVTLVAMGEEDEKGRGLCNNARSVTARTKRSRESRELRTGDTDKAWDGSEGLGRLLELDRRWESWPKVRLRVSEIVISEWESEIMWMRLKRIEMRGVGYVSWRWVIEILGFITLYICEGIWGIINYIYNWVRVGFL